jgi:hypothetical protein
MRANNFLSSWETIKRLCQIYWDHRKKPPRIDTLPTFLPSCCPSPLQRTSLYLTPVRTKAGILVPTTEHGYFFASWWRAPLRHPPNITRFYFQQTSGIHAPVGKRKGGSLCGRSHAPIADSFHVATMARKHSVLNLEEINRNNTHTALASVLTYYGWVSLIF